MLKMTLANTSEIGAKTQETVCVCVFGYTYTHTYIDYTTCSYTHTFTRTQTLTNELIWPWQGNPNRQYNFAISYQHQLEAILLISNNSFQ